jgi:hypothetical protein
MKRIILIATIIVLTLFALITLFMSSSMIFDWFGIREREGNYVLFVVVANFICGLIYLVAVYGLILKKRWATYLLILSVTILILTFIGLWFHINSGGLYETQTIKAMLFRISVSSLFAGIAWYLLGKNSKTLVNQ